MHINYQENNIRIIEKVLNCKIRDIFIRLKMGLADWDIDEVLREALTKSSQLDKVKDITEQYDAAFEMSVKSNIKIDEKYKILYKLENK